MTTRGLEMNCVQTLSSSDLSQLINGQSQKAPSGPVATVTRLISINIEDASWAAETVVAAYLGGGTLVTMFCLGREGL